MSNNLPPIYFYFPYYKSFINLPKNVKSYWSWQCAEHSISPMQSGGWFWTLQTYLYLKEHSFPCKLVNTIPDEGIVLSHKDFLDDFLKPSAKLLIVCLRADVDRHPYAQLHVVQNPYQAIPRGFMTLWESHFIPHWPQPSIIPRNPERGNIFENVTFLGNEINLVPEFRQQIWYDRLKGLGLKFQKKLNHNEWHDYSDIDVVLAIRELGRHNDWRGKPASKLYSAWHAGVPAILGYESAFQAERKSNLDYLEATSLEEAISALNQLRDKPELRHAMIENGLRRARETQPSNMIFKWQYFLTQIAVPAYENWRSMPHWKQQFFLNARQSFINLRPAYYHLKSQFSLQKKNLSTVLLDK